MSPVDRVRRAVRSPLAWVLGAAFALRLVGLAWGLPASDGWDNDGIAPRDFLPGLVESFTPGHYFTYPPGHLALLAVLTLPVTLVMLARAPSLSPASVVAEAIKVPYMTSYAAVARLVSALMSVAIIWAVAKLAEEAWGKRAGVLAAAMCAANVVLTYYGHTTNLDVPCLFWASLALVQLARAIARHEPRRLRRFAVLAALSVASKDQGYAIFALGAPLALGAWVALDDWPRANARAVLKELALGAALGAALLLLVDGALTNPSGFRARLAFLTGPASQPHAYYPATWEGRARVVVDSVASFDMHYALGLAPFVLFGLWRALRGAARGGADDGGRRAAGLVALCAIASFTIAFNCVARRCEHRFLMPQMVLWSVYGGIGVDALLAFERRAVRVAAGALAACALAWSLFLCADMDANLVLDPRYDVEAWLAAHVAPGDVVEVHGYTVYLPRFPPQAHVVRVGTDPPRARNPILGAEEKEDRYMNIEARRPRFIVVSMGYAPHYLDTLSSDVGWGRAHSAKQRETSGDDDQATFFRALFAGKLRYAQAHVSTWTSAFWPRVDIHGSVARDVVVFERKPEDAP